MATPATVPFSIQVDKAPDAVATKTFVLRISGLYLHHAWKEPNPTVHETILSPNGTHGFGATVANNWAIYNGPDPSADTVLARARGLHIMSGDDWHNSFSIVFETDDWLKGSTLLVMGVGVEKVEKIAQWGIVGGTGQLTMAQGFINRKLHQKDDTANILQLDIYATFQDNLIKDGPKGGTGGQAREPMGAPYRLENIKIRESSAGAIASIEFTYLDQYGMRHTEGPWGGNGPYGQTLTLGATEFIKEVTGTVSNVNGSDVVSSLKFVTNLRTRSYGKELGTPFNLPEKTGGTIVGFFARASEHVNAIGVLMRP